MNRFNYIIFIAIACVSMFGCKTISKKDNQGPNILFIMADDHTTQAIGAYNSRLSVLDPTPNIDSIARTGIVFEDVFCTNSICTPSRASIITGQYSQTNGVLDLHSVLPVKEQYLPIEMKKLGYETAVFGKWHLKSAPEKFDYYEVFPLQGQYHDPEIISRNGKITKKINFAKGLSRVVKITKYKGHSSDVITNRTLNWLKNIRDKSKPFLLLHHFKAPHDNFLFADRYKTYLQDAYIPEPASLYQKGNNGLIATRGKNNSLIHVIGSSVGMRNTIRGMGRDIDMGLKPDDPDYKHKAYQEYVKRYLRCVKGVDDNVKRIIDYLRQTGELKNTIVIYTSDQGRMLGSHDFIDKRWMYEESMRMPFIVSYPKAFKKNFRSNVLINNTDFAPTLIDIAGGKVPDYMQGHSFKSVLETGKKPKDWRHSTYYRYWMHMGSRHANPAHFGLRTDRYKLIFFYGRYYIPGTKSDSWGRYDFNTPPGWEFYDLKRDPQEMQNEYHNPKYKAIIAKLKIELIAKRKKLNEEDVAYPNIQKVIDKHWND